MTNASPTPPGSPELDPDSAPAPANAITFGGIFILLLFLAVGFALGIAYERYSRPYSQSASVHLPTVPPVKNGLDPKFVDANNDLVADAPKDPAQWQDPDTLIFTFVAHKAAERNAEVFKDLLDAIAKETGKKIEVRRFETVGDEVRALASGKLHIAAFNTGGVPEAVFVAGFVPFAALANDSGFATYEMEIIVPTSSDVRSISDLKGAELVFTSADSNSGCKAPRVILDREFGLIADRDYTTRFSGSHEASIIGVASKIYPVAAIANDVLARMSSSGIVEPKSIRSLYKSKPFPPPAFGYPHNLKPELAEKIRAAFLGFQLKGSSLEKNFRETKFAEVDFKRDWKIIREIDDASGHLYSIEIGK